MTRVLFVGSEEVDLRAELLSRETARDALVTYQLREPYRNCLELETISVGSATSLLNDLNWYLVRFVDEALILEPSISEEEWLSRKLAAQVRDGDLNPAETDPLLKMYGVEKDEFGKELVEPMYVARTVDGVPEYDLRDVDETLVARVTESEFRS
ncbi:DUF5804 family protein [Haladaptatus pallidirubidus]|uniref:DUF5804 family protein n=1 Tax=Haladaptatus pallidirubidus TaxID=1008152 RepID=A0AAV3UD59_9EURY|nr:DUF5804 family protein [Haladaptatus pallidirubidus]